MSGRVRRAGTRRAKAPRARCPRCGRDIAYTPSYNPRIGVVTPRLIFRDHNDPETGQRCEWWQAGPPAQRG